MDLGGFCVNVRDEGVVFTEGAFREKRGEMGRPHGFWFWYIPPDHFIPTAEVIHLIIDPIIL